MICALIAEAVVGGARRNRACRTIGLSVRTVERWCGAHPADARDGPRLAPANQMTTEERATILATINSAPYRDLSPKQIVPRLADHGLYLASESTIYRILRAEEQLAHRGRAAAPVRRHKPIHTATGPNQLWSWDITYLRTPVRGIFWYLYLILDVWSRKIVGWAVYAEQSDRLASDLFIATCTNNGLNPKGIVLHADNGGPMKGATMQITLERLGVVPSFSRPGVSDDNPYSEAVFRTLKYCLMYPSKPFPTIPDAIQWMETFVQWYNHDHRHSGIRFVTPEQRHSGCEHAILAQRHAVYEEARSRRPDRWSGTTRNWTPITEVYINPEHEVNQHNQKTTV